MGKTCFTKKVLSSTTCEVIFYINTGSSLENQTTSDLPEEHHLQDGHEPHPRALGVHPPHVRPGLWRKLQEHPLDPARFGADVFEGLPVVLAHLEVVADAHADPDAEPVADEDVEEDIVPPALVAH